jgi:hypothetical protein
MRFYRLILNFEDPFGEVEFRRTVNNFPFKEKSLGISWDRNEFMPLELLEGEFSLTDESEYLDVLKVSHLGWEGLLVNEKILNILKGFKLQEHRLEELLIYADNNELNKKTIPYKLLHFHSNGFLWVHQIIYSRTIKKSGNTEDFAVSYKEFIEKEISIPVVERISRKIKIAEIKFVHEKFADGFFDLFYNTFLFKSDFIISAALRNALEGLSGFNIDEGPIISGA